MKAILLIFVAACAFAQTNSMTIKLPCNNLASDAFMQEFRYVGQRWCDSGDSSKIKEWNGSAWVEVPGSTPGQFPNYPLKFARPFLQGEIANYPQVLQNGVARTTQANVKQRHPDGSVKHAVISVILPSHSTSGSMLTFQNQVSGNDTAPMRDVLLNSQPDADAKMIFTPDTNNCPSCTAKTVSARTMLANAPSSIPMCQGAQQPPCYLEAGAVATTVLLADHTGKSYDVGWKRAEPTTLAVPGGASGHTITGVSGKAATAIGAIDCASGTHCDLAVTGHLLVAGDKVTISGSSVTNLNGSDRLIASVPDGNTVRISQSINATSQALTTLSLSGSGSGGTITPTWVTVTFSGGPSTFRQHPFWPGNQVVFANVGGSGLSGTKLIVRHLATNTFQVSHTPTGAYTTGGTARLSLIQSRTPYFHLTSVAGMTAPTWTTAMFVSASQPLNHSDRICTVDNTVSPPIVWTGDEACKVFTLDAGSLAHNATSAAITGFEAYYKPAGSIYYFTGFGPERIWVLDDGAGPLELVYVSSVSGTTVNFLRREAGTRRAFSGTIQLYSVGRDRQYAGNSGSQNFTGYRDITIGSTPTVHPATFAEVATTADEVHRTVRPYFTTTFWHELGTYEVEATAGIEDTQRWGDQFYSPKITVGLASPVTRYPVLARERTEGSLWPHSAGSRWTRKYWGPGIGYPRIDIDHNMTYVRATKATEYYSVNHMLSTTGRDAEINHWVSLHRTRKDLLGTADFETDQPAAGGRGELGPQTRTTTRAIMCGSLQDCWKVWYIAEMYTSQAATFADHFRMGSPDPALVATNPSDDGARVLYYGRQNCTATGDSCDQADVDFRTNNVMALGRVINPRVYPRASLRYITNGAQVEKVPVAADRIPIRGANMNLTFRQDTAHTYDPGSILYLFTGRWFFLEEGMFWAAYHATEESQTDIRGPDHTYACCGYGEIRAHGRKLDLRNNVWSVLPDGLPEKTYFSQAIKEFIVAETDSRQMTSSYSTEPGLVALSDWAKTTRAQATVSPLGIWGKGGSGTVSQSDPEINGAFSGNHWSLWTQYLPTAAFGRAQQLGFTGARDIKEFLGKFIIGGLTTAGVNKYLLSQYYSSTAIRAFASEAAIQTALDATPASDHCRVALALTSANFMLGGSPLPANTHWPNWTLWQCAQSNVATTDFQGYKATKWRQVTAGGTCDSNHSWSLLLHRANTFLRGMANWDAAIAVTTNEILGESTCQNAWAANPKWIVEPRPDEGDPPQVLSITPSNPAPSCVAGAAAPTTIDVAIAVSPTPEVAYTLSDDAAWFSFTSGATGTTPANAAASIDCSGLSAGPYTANLTATAVAVTNGTAQVNLTVTPAVTETASIRSQVAGSNAIVFLLRRSRANDSCTLTLDGITPVVIGGGLTVAEEVVTGLTAATSYPASLTCASGATWSGTLDTSNAPGGTAIGRADIGGSRELNADNVLIEYGDAPDNLSQSLSLTCNSGCTFEPSGTRRSIIFYRYTWRDGANNAISQPSSVRRVVVP